MRGKGVEGAPFGRYRLLELLGRGGMGEVWRAHDTATNRVVALKVLLSNLTDNPGFEQRFRREAYTAAALSEPHVVPIHNFGEIDGRLYVDMRLIEGRNLDSVLADGPMSPTRAVTIIEQVAAALRAAHKVGLVHRDIKPSNILIAEDDFAYLIDFGIARIADQTSLTASGTVIGTWAYMAPERFSAEADWRSDIYALACVLYECLTGARPFPGNSIEQQIAGHITAPPPRPSTIMTEMPAAMDEVIAKGMAKSPKDRYQSATDFAKAARVALMSPDSLPLSGDPTQPPTVWNPRQQVPVGQAVYQQSVSHSSPSSPPQWQPATAPYISPGAAAGLDRPRRRLDLRAITVLSVPLLILVAAITFAVTTTRLYLADKAEAEAKRAVVQTATAAIEALWTYTPDDMDGLPARAGRYLTGDFRTQYAKLVDGMIPAYKEAQLSSKTQVVGAGVESLHGSDATALVYTNTSSTTPQTRSAPSLKYLSYRLIMQKHDSGWLISKMTTVTSMDLEPKLPGSG
jgi:serine/threonine protein kinase